MPIGEYILNEPADRPREAVRWRGAERLLIGRVSGFQRAAPGPGRIVRFWPALSNELRAVDATAPRVPEPQEPAGPGLRVPMTGTASPSEVMASVRHAGFRSRLRSPIPLLGARVEDTGPAIREFTTSGTGIVADEPFKGAEAVPSEVAQGAARKVARKAARGRPAVARGNVGQGLTGCSTGHPG